MSETPLVLDGFSLTPEALSQASCDGTKIALSKDGLARMENARSLIDNAIAKKVPVYGVTTGLGARVTETLDAEALSEFSYQTLRGRAHAVGRPAPVEVVRASMIIRANTLLIAAAAANPRVAHHYVECLNAGLTPIVGELGSIGAGDLVWNATLGLALIGEGPMRDASGVRGSGAQLLEASGIKPLELGPRDGLAICNHSSYSAAASALAFVTAQGAYEAVQTSAALTLEGFRAHLSPYDPRVLKLRPQPGQSEAAAGILARLEGSALINGQAARRLQDPLSIRTLPQIHGAVHAALAFASEAITMEINGASDNPAAIVDDKVIVSAGAFHTPHLTNTLETVSRGFAHLATAQLARMSKMLSNRYTGLTQFLAEPDSGSNRFAPVMKTGESIVAELLQAAKPVELWPSVNADGVEDSLTNTPTAARGLAKVAELSSYLTAIELLIAAAAIDQRGIAAQLGPRMKTVLMTLRTLSPPIAKDRPLSDDIDAVAAHVRSGAFGLAP